MPISYVGHGATASGTGAISVAAPAGFQAGDVLVIQCETGAQSMAVPAGWTGSTQFNSGNTRSICFIKLSDGNETSVALTDSGDHQIAKMSAFRGVDPVNMLGPASFGSSLTGQPLSGGDVTTTVDGSWLLALVNGASATSFSAPGWADADVVEVTERYDDNSLAGDDGSIALFTGRLPVAGPSGNFSCQAAASTGTALLLITLQPVPSVAYAMAAASGGHSTTGSAAALRSRRRLVAGAGTVSVTGAAVTLRRGYRLAAGGAAYVLAAPSVLSRKALRVTAAAGAHAVAGGAAVLRCGYRRLFAGESYALTGSIAQFKAQLRVFGSEPPDEARRLQLPSKIRLAAAAARAARIAFAGAAPPRRLLLQRADRGRTA